MPDELQDPEVAAAVRAIGTASDTYGPTLNTAVSPAAVETIGRALAEVLRGFHPTAIAVWDTGDEAVLTHVIARELDATVLRASEVEGAVTFGSDVTRGTRVALVATAWQDPRRLTTLRTLARANEAEVVAVAAVLGTPAQQAVDDVPTVCVTTTSGGDPV